MKLNGFRLGRSNGGDQEKRKRASKVKIELLQRYLTEAGFPTRTTGLLAEETRQAIRGLQRASGLPETGTIDQPTLTALKARLRLIRLAQLSGRGKPLRKT
jgi:peptidoglycan hydrolase-like protein with peptidoglycan-binding domain